MGDGSSSELALGQFKQDWAGRVRSTLTSSRGSPQVPSAIGDVEIHLTHLVLRRDSSGRRTLFVDGRERGMNMAPGSLQPWSDHRLALGDEVSDNDPWAGRIYRVAIYCRALTDREVAASYAAGP
jgi:hypothetical protein